MELYWHWQQIVFCGVMFLVGFGIGHLTGMHESLEIVSKNHETEKSE